MRLVLQRVSRASVTIDKGETRSTGAGLMVLAGFCGTDTPAVSAWIAEKMAGLRIFDDGEGAMNLSLADVGGDCLVVSNFTLYAQCKKGRRPSFIEAARPEISQELYDGFVEEVRARVQGAVATGEFGAQMDIDILCDGPVTILLDSDEIMPKKA